MKIITATGSVYIVTNDNGRWWLSGKNKATWASAPIEGTWEIKEPKVELGKSAELISVYVNEPANPLRIPGGGKITSPVIAIEE